MADVPEGFWANLLDYIQDRTVVPILGPELVTVREGDREIQLYRWLAERLAADLGLPTAELPQGFDLNDVVSLHQRLHHERDELYPRINRILGKAALSPPESLLALAGIPGFDLFVSLTFDSLLADALGAVRTGGGPPVESIAYSPKKRCDLPSPEVDRQRVVFHLLGRASASPGYTICDEDLLELLLALQDKQRQPTALFDKLHDNHLLILGCSFADWLARFFVRTARRVELSQKRHCSDMLVGDHMAQDAGLALFLESFGSETRIVPLPAAQFVAELAKRWHAAHPAEAPSAEPVVREGGTGGKSIPTGAIFVSYASEDLEAASRLAAGLRAAQLEVWFDKDALQMGQNWARNIRNGIKECSLFLPVISRQAMSEENSSSYFWREWNDADDLAREKRPDVVFILPVVIDDTHIDRVPVPDSFRKAQAKSLPGGNLPKDVADLLGEIVKKFHRRQGAA
ncbi:MAG TPA: toll/interleukin-1 receptor domain-containing protein [Thermoanaerobaculia bacterium]|nr:toll/interleukin-1 receptor domain-containing protein [Thermoanaerobaculia bacterium]